MPSPVQAFAITRRMVILMSAALAIAVIAPFWLEGFRLFQLTQILAFSIAIMGLNLLTGFNGQLSLGHGAFYAIGAYAVAVSMTQLGAPYWVAVPIAGLVGFGVGFLFGFPALKLEGHYLALGTFALATAVPQLIKYQKFNPVMGGVGGLSLVKPSAPFWFPVSDDLWIYFFALLFAVVFFWIAFNLVRGDWGRTIMAIRDDPVAAEAMGVNIARTKTIVFGLSAMYAAIGGGISAVAVQFVAPDSFTLFLSIYLLVGMVLGGVGSFAGPLLGAAAIVLIPNLAGQISTAASGAILALIVLLLVFVVPGGLAMLLARLFGYRR